MLTEALIPRVIGTRAAAVEIDRDRAHLGEGVNRQMRLREKEQGRDAAFTAEMMNERAAYRQQPKLLDDALEERARGFGIT